jgi:hypothetical protein
MVPLRMTEAIKFQERVIAELIKVTLPASEGLRPNSPDGRVDPRLKVSPSATAGNKSFWPAAA